MTISTLTNAGLTVTMLAALTMVGCGKDGDPTSAETEAPALPPVRTMQFDFSFFDDGAGAREALSRESDTDLAQLNWLNAAARVGLINVAVVTALTPPSAAFALAIHEEPVLQEDESFLWSYQWSDGQGAEARIDLTGRIDGVHVDWELAVTSNEMVPPVENAVWFHGRSSVIEDAGYWIFTDLAGTDVARVEWVAEESLSFENIEVDGADLGDHLEYHVDGTDISVSWHDESEAVDAVIQWSTSTGAGNLTVPDYNDGQTACWDEQQMDVDCDPVL